MNQTVCKLRENKVTILRPRNGVRQARAPLEFGTTKIGAEDSGRALLASQGLSLRAKEPRKDSPPAAPEAWTGWPDRQGRQGAKPITEKKEWARDQWVLRNAPSGSHAPKLSSGALWQGPESQGEGRAGGRGKESPRSQRLGKAPAGTTAPDNTRSGARRRAPQP